MARMRRLLVVVTLPGLVLSACAAGVASPAEVIGSSVAPGGSSASAQASSGSASTSPSPIRSSTIPAPTVAATGASGVALAAVLALPVKGRAPKTGYARAQFGTAWLDVDHNGCDTRDDMLIRDLTARVMSGSCRVMSGTLADPYTGKTILFVRGGVSEVDIDHMVALSDAWQTGAATWLVTKRVALANDPLNLQPTDSSANRQKGDSDAASWLPPAVAYRCTYVARQAAVKRKYGLWVTSAERSAMLLVLARCPGQRLPA